jgi:ankyrin repeat protein
MTPLHLAVLSGSVATVATLLARECSRHAMVRAGPLSGLTALHIAAALGLQDIMKRLLAANLDVNAPSVRVQVVLP